METSVLYWNLIDAALELKLKFKSPAALFFNFDGKRFTTLVHNRTIVC